MCEIFARARQLAERRHVASRKTDITDSGNASLIILGGLGLNDFGSNPMSPDIYPRKVCATENRVKPDISTESDTVKILLGVHVEHNRTTISPPGCACFWKRTNKNVQVQMRLSIRVWYYKSSVLSGTRKKWGGGGRG